MSGRVIDERKLRQEIPDMGDAEAHFVGFRNDVFLWSGLYIMDLTFSEEGSSLRKQLACPADRGSLTDPLTNGLLE